MNCARRNYCFIFGYCIQIFVLLKIIEKMIPFLIIIHHGYVEIFIKIKIFGIFPVR